MNQPPSGNFPPPNDKGQQGQGWQPPSQGNYPPPGSYPPPPQGGNYPPPQQGDNYPPPGNYPPPPQGSYPPPPPGNYPPPPPGYYPPPGYPAPGGSELSIGDGFSWAWKQFGKNALALLIPTFIYGVIVSIISWVVYYAAIAASPNSYSSYSESGDMGFSAGFSMGSANTVVLFLGGLVASILLAVISAAYYGGLLAIADGQQVSIGSFFRPQNIGAVLIASIIIGVLESIGQALCFIPGLIVSLFMVFAIVAIVDRRLSAIDGIKFSFNLVKDNFAKALLVWLVALLIMFVGALLCGIGLLVAFPVALLFEVYAFRRLTGGQVVPAA